MKGKERASDEDLKLLNESERTIWTDNAESDYWKPKVQFKGDLGRVYGIQWRNWRAPDGSVVDQIAELIKKLKTAPYDRRLIVSAWNPGELADMALLPCHMFFQCFVSDGALSLHMVQRSCDMFLGVPFNIASYSLLLHMLAQVTGLIGQGVHPNPAGCARVPRTFRCGERTTFPRADGTPAALAQSGSERYRRLRHGGYQARQLPEPPVDKGEDDRVAIWSRASVQSSPLGKSGVGQGGETSLAHSRRPQAFQAAHLRASRHHGAQDFESIVGYLGKPLPDRTNIVITPFYRPRRSI